MSDVWVGNTRPKKPNPYRGQAGSSAYKRKAATLKNSPEGAYCCICGAEIDRSLPPSEANSPGYWTVEHDPPLSQGGDLLKDIKGPAHRGCNSSLGGKLAHPQMNHDDFDPSLIEHSRNW